MSRYVKLLKPELQDIIIKFIDKCEQQNLKVLITQTFRSKAEQDQIYAKGRTAPGNIVTDVRYPNSAHCWGIAFDIARNIPDHLYDSNEFFVKCSVIAKSLGLRWGGDWKKTKDSPHFELPIGVGSLILQHKNPTNYIKSWEVLEEVDTKSNQPSEWAKDAWKKAVKQKVFDGTDPKGNLTREQLALILVRLGVIK